MAGPPRSKTAPTARFARRRAEILNVASAQINLYGAGGLTLTAVARELGLDTSSVTYYFRFKDELAAACLERTIKQLQLVADAALQEASRCERVEAFMARTVDVYRKQRDPGVETLTTLSDLSALDESVAVPLRAAYDALFQTVRRLFEGADQSGARSLISGNVFLASALWMAAWVHQYQTADLDRVCERLCAIFVKGMRSDPSWSVDSLPLEDAEGANDAQTKFLHAATNLINSTGYKGASVEKIANELGVSVGSFYHHLSGKDDLVLACFDRTFRILEAAQLHARALYTRPGARLGALVSLLITFQFSAESPLLRTSAYQTLPPELRAKMFDRTRAATLHIAGLVADAIAEGALQPVDPLIASQVLLAGIHAAADLRAWAARRPLTDAVAAYSAVLQQGVQA